MTLHKPQYDLDPPAAFEWIKKFQCPVLLDRLSPSILHASISFMERQYSDIPTEYMWGSLPDINMHLIISKREVNTFHGERAPSMTPVVIATFYERSSSEFRHEYDDLNDFATDTNRFQHHTAAFPVDERIWFVPYLFRCQIIRLQLLPTIKLSVLHDVPEHHKRARAMNLIPKRP